MKKQNNGASFDVSNKSLDPKFGAMATPTCWKSINLALSASQVFTDARDAGKYVLNSISSVIFR